MTEGNGGSEDDDDVDSGVEGEGDAGRLGKELGKRETEDQDEDREG